MIRHLPSSQKENARHGEQMFPLQKYITTLSDSYPAVTAHWHEEAEFTLITEGCCNYQIQLASYEVCPGDIIFLPPAVLHSIQAPAGEQMMSETYVFHMNFLGISNADVCAVRYLTPLAAQKLIPPFVIKKEHPAYPDALSLFHAVSKAYGCAAYGYELMLKSLLLQLIAVLLPYCRKESELPQLYNEHARKLKLVLEYIEAHYSEPLCVADLASLCCFSEYHFMRFFKKYVGLSCMDYVRSIRLEKAAELFGQGNSSALEVSLSVGFGNLSYFHREFKKKFGMTPKKFCESLEKLPQLSQPAVPYTGMHTKLPPYPPQRKEETPSE